MLAEMRLIKVHDEEAGRGHVVDVEEFSADLTCPPEDNAGVGGLGVEG